MSGSKYSRFRAGASSSDFAIPPLKAPPKPCGLEVSTEVDEHAKRLCWSDHVDIVGPPFINFRGWVAFVSESCAGRLRASSLFLIPHGVDSNVGGS